MNTKQKNQRKSKGNNESHCRPDQGNTAPVGNLPNASGKGMESLHRGAPGLGAGEAGTARRNVGKAPGHPRPGGPAAATSPAEAAAPGVKIHLRFNAKQWRDICVCAAHDQQAPEAWLREYALSCVPVTLEEIHRQTIPERQRKAQEEELMSKIRHVMAWSAESIFSLQEKRAIDLCAEWNGMDFNTLVRDSALASLVALFGEMESLLEFRPKENQAWGRPFHRKLAPVMAALGWDGSDIAAGRAKA